MSGSFPVFDAVLQHAIACLAPRRALDVGAGAGKYGQLLAAQAPACHRSAIERDPSCVQQHGLETLYDRVWVGDSAAWLAQTQPEVFDLVLIGQCLEHNAKSAGLDLLQALLHRCAWLVVVVAEHPTPVVVDQVAQSPCLSIWTERDMHWHDLWAWDNCRSTTLLVLRGLLSSALTLVQLVDAVNSADVPVRHFDGVTAVRPARLRLVDHRRELDYRPL